MPDTHKVETGQPKRVTFAAQASLPKIPIPTLQDTCRRYLKALEPFENAVERKVSEASVAHFIANEGPKLQEKLEEYANEKSSYIEEFWYDSYLNFDNPVVLNLNPFFLLEDDPTPARNQQIPRATSLIISSLSFVRALRKEELEPDSFRGTPLCMYQYQRLFGTSRIPTTKGCIMKTDETSKHIVVLCRSQFYWFDVLDDNSDVAITEKELNLNLDAIIRDSYETPTVEAAQSAVGVLTTENRRTWAGIRQHILNDKTLDQSDDDDVSFNSAALKMVDTALFIVCLDDTEPVGCAELSANMLSGTYRLENGVQMGTCTNRWYDKLQIIVCKNGSAGINFEHTGVDGHTVLRFVSDIYTDTILRFAQSINPSAPTLWASSSPDPAKRSAESLRDVEKMPRKLEWSMNPDLSTGIRFAETRLSDLLLQNEVEGLEFQGYGKNFIVSMGLSPDAFVQMAFQAAYFGLYGRLEVTYEPAMTKMFLHGRTEAIYVVAPETLNFVQRFWENVSTVIKVEALRKACKKHTATTKECSQAQGHHRHLYALLCIWKRNLDANFGARANGNMDLDGSRSTSPDSVFHEELPALFADAGWDKLGNIVLSTSNCGNQSLRMFGFGAVSADGFGIGYIIKDNAINICASSKHRQTKRFLSVLQSYLLEIRALLKATAPTQRPDIEPISSRPSIEKSGRRISHTAYTNNQEPDADEFGGMEGYGYFDMGSMTKLSKLEEEKISAANGQADARSKVFSSAAIGRRLRLAEY